jgi:hypothetical protein
MTLMTRQDGSGSPHCRHNGGVNGTMAFQHLAHTGPAVGASRIVSHAAQAGARTTARTPSRSERRPDDRRVRLSSRALAEHSFITDVDALGIAPQTFQRVELAGLRDEYVDDEVEEIHQHPLGTIVSLDV